jgi:hypothetical protein
MRKLNVGMFFVSLAIGVPSPALAQLAWDSPYLTPPKAQEGLGLFLVDVPGGDLGVMGTWRSPARSFGMRLGLAEARGGDLGVFGGIDFLGQMTRSTTEFPLDIDWLLGAGVGISDGVLISAPAGLTLGHDFSGDGVGFTPYLSPRVILDACLDCDDRGDDNDLRLDFAVDIGLDIRLTPSVAIRFGATLGDREGVGIGLLF